LQTREKADFPAGAFSPLFFSSSAKLLLESLLCLQKREREIESGGERFFSQRAKIDLRARSSSFLNNKRELGGWRKYFNLLAKKEDSRSGRQRELSVLNKQASKIFFYLQIKILCRVNLFRHEFATVYRNKMRT